MSRTFRLRKNIPKNLKVPLKPIETSKYKSKTAPSSLILYDPAIKSLVNYTRGIGNKGSKDYIPSSIEVIYGIFKDLGGKERAGSLIKNSSLNISLNEKTKTYIDPKGRFKVEVLDHTASNFSLNTFSSYKLTIRKDGKNKVLYIKNSVGNLSHRNAVQEMVLLKYLEKNGVSIIKPRFAFTKTRLLEGIHFIAYDFTSLKNIEQSFLTNKITEKEFKKINSEITTIRNRFRKHSFYIEDIMPKNFFYKRLPNGEIKLYLIDVFSMDFVYNNKNFTGIGPDKGKILEFAKKEGIVK